WHARDFVPAQDYAIKNYQCTNVNGFMFNHCTVTFVSLQSRVSRQFTDWRFGRAPREPIQLLQRRGDASAVTTDVSLQTVWNRQLVVLTFLSFGALVAMALIAQAFKDEAAPVGAPGAEPALQPAVQRTARAPSAGRAGFGRRHA